ncbi:MAG: GGDEF domain-containing protein [Proteobacteria bacterium]|nr:GGDEF domain-containing protein [Pseudomonadota bacterium]MCP4916222.1 GGDEF domain-containing protein [Pseudomonadota bacterium]
MKDWQADLSYGIRFAPFAVVPTGLVLLVEGHAPATGEFQGLLIVGSLATLVLMAVTYLGFQRRIVRNVETRLRERMVRTDPLTELGTRQALQEALRSRPRAICVLLSFDLEGLRVMNDEHGQEAGDKLLIAFAEVLRTSTRIEQDQLFRTGGDEFVALLHSTSPAEAEVVAGRIPERLSASAKEIAPVEVGVSIGGARWREAEPAAEWLSRSDGAMKASKAAGTGLIWAPGDAV